MAAAEIMPASTDTPLPRGSHPYMVRETLANAVYIALGVTRDGQREVQP
jgi:hypothetical protein